MDEPNEIWHYGLMAERWAEVLNDTPELEFLKERIEHYGEPVLDVACGTGRLLRPLAKAGVDIDGLDYSADMLRHCRRLGDLEGLGFELYQGSMAELDPPRKYGLIYIVGSFGLAASRDLDFETLKRCHKSLKAGGALILNIQAEYTDRETWSRWSTDYREHLPEPWPAESRDKVAADGSLHRAYFRLVDMDPLEHQYTREVRLEKWVEETLVASEQYSLTGRMYLAPEVRLMLRCAGFSQVALTGDYREQAATSWSEELVFTAIK